MDYITTEQLKQQIIDLGFELEFNQLKNHMWIKDDFNRKVASIRINRMYTFDTNWDSFDEIDIHMQKQLYSLINRYALTPLDKRITEKKYQLRLDISNKIDNNWQILAKNTESGILQVGSGSGSEIWQTVFTEAEIDEMGDLTKGFVKEEVSE